MKSVALRTRNLKRRRRVLHLVGGGAPPKRQNYQITHQRQHAENDEQTGLPRDATGRTSRMHKSRAASIGVKRMVW
jgi:hypothetical protein